MIAKNSELVTQNRTIVSEKATAELAKTTISSDKKINADTYKSLVNENQHSKKVPTIQRDLEQSI